ncbi:MobA/MobL family protein [Mesorhizobium sp. B2-4-13]|uniref:MobA/MobL family protein n=1 Tax=Mesorhizobium sp. B2-4-13 TaxID=2589936 RepID=UPI0015EF5673|nr:MobA/MobL family protein [Mesorhizobium sp. B2-4-13]
MAIYSLHHSSIGKSTQAQPYTAGAHASYITRKSALSQTASGRCPDDKDRVTAYLRHQEDKVRKNGRVADKLMLALPRELTAEQRVALVRAFAEDVTAGRAVWFAAFHEKGKDSVNPHCHLIVCDRDVKSGVRVFGTSEKGSTERLRRLWEHHANAALAQANRKERIDRRTLEAQGIRRRPTIHVGVRSRQLVRDNKRLQSRPRMIRNNCQARTRQRRVDYPTLDRGKLRLEENVDIRHANYLDSRVERREAEYWEAIDRDAYRRDIMELKRLNAVLQYSEDGRDITGSRDERGRGGGRER